MGATALLGGAVANATATHQDCKIPLPLSRQVKQELHQPQPIFSREGCSGNIDIEFITILGALTGAGIGGLASMQLLTSDIHKLNETDLTRKIMQNWIDDRVSEEERKRHELRIYIFTYESLGYKNELNQLLNTKTSECINALSTWKSFLEQYDMNKSCPLQYKQTVKLLEKANKILKNKQTKNS